MSSSQEGTTQIVLVRQQAAAAPGAIAAVRLLGVLPPDWACTWDVADDLITLRVRIPGGGGGKAAASVVADRAPAGWSAPR
ncbi:hypothetical protein FBY35_3412 [Streptomyces sp. SLBN-118]|uniref:hypothetical protein n=1 Tax=Streptomyces sp. SLBN-118 TaxID=2768454 RepID=UPI00115147CB|nr:hypothetical protein [Streptomyces sp. SLBN-118]TQK52949.1 hypothetical protein FBY35_3412 [Streptomyces sp. SLBN-118]